METNVKDTIALFGYPSPNIGMDRTAQVKLLDKLVLPGIKEEDWKYTRVGAMAKISLKNDAVKEIKADIEFPESETHLTFVNGKHVSGKSTAVVKRWNECTDADKK
jgi:hypothetical protein